jgi:hypothetical protein
MVVDLQKLEVEEAYASALAPCTYTCSWTCWITSFQN